MPIPHAQPEATQPVQPVLAEQSVLTAKEGAVEGLLLGLAEVLWARVVVVVVRASRTASSSNRRGSVMVSLLFSVWVGSVDSVDCG